MTSFFKIPAAAVTYHFRHYLIFTSLCMPLVCLSATPGSQLPEPLDYAVIAQNYEPMDLGGLDREVASALGAYYQQSYGGTENWQKIQSVRLEGVLSLPQGDFPFIAFKKKPAYCKVVLRGADRPLMVLSYDGHDAWQWIPEQSAEPVDMPSAEALNFIRDAILGSHLLYVQVPGKKISFLGTEELGGVLCRNFEVVLPNGEVLHYSLGIRDSRLRRQIAYNTSSGLKEVTMNHQFRDVGGVSIATRSTNAVNGQQVHEVRIAQADFNPGLVPWMFSRPSGAYVPRAVEEDGMGALPDFIPDSLMPEPPALDAFPSFQAK